LANKESHSFTGATVTTVRDAKDLVNALFATAKIDVQVIELVVGKEAVVIGYPQIENYEDELESVDRRDDVTRMARYLAAATIITEGRKVQVYTRFYLTSEGKLKIEGCDADNVTLVGSEEAEKPDRWKGALEVAERWGPVIIQLIITLLGCAQ
jgi:hypothetical protein